MSQSALTSCLQYEAHSEDVTELHTSSEADSMSLRCTPTPAAPNTRSLCRVKFLHVILNRHFKHVLKIRGEI